MRAVLVLSLVLGVAGEAAAHENVPGPRPRVVVVTTSIEVFEPIRFRAGAAIAPESTRMLDAIAAALAGNPELGSIEVRVRARSRSLALRRSRAIVEELVARGVVRARLRAAGVRDARSSTTELVILDDEPAR